MSIFDVEERRILELEKEEAEKIASDERQRELDDLPLIEKLIQESDNIYINKDGSCEEDVKDYALIMQEALRLLKHKIIGSVIILPNGFMPGQIIYMIPTFENGLKQITAYRLLRFVCDSFGVGADLCTKKKERGVEHFFFASLDMFNKSIFKSIEEAISCFEKTIDKCEGV